MSVAAAGIGAKIGSHALQHVFLYAAIGLIGVGIPGVAEAFTAVGHAFMDGGETVGHALIGEAGAPSVDH